MWPVSTSWLQHICYDRRIDINVTMTLTYLFPSGIIGSKTYGVAKQVTIHSVRVLNNEGKGKWSDVILAINFLMNVKMNDPSRKMVANMSLGGGSYSLIDDAVNKAVAAGVIMVVAAGNDNINACNTSPAAASGAITVGATTSADTRASYSNYGSCVDIFAPGSGIVSLSQTQGQPVSADGTSMAAPHVVGAIAMYLEAGKTVADMLNDASVGLISGVGSGSPNRFLAVKLARPATKAPTKSPIKSPTKLPTKRPTKAPTKAPVTKPPTLAPVTKPPTRVPTKAPTRVPTKVPTKAPVKPPTRMPTKAPVVPTANSCLPLRRACTRAAQCCSGRCRRNLCRQA
jgi:hypothetical protein